MPGRIGEHVVTLVELEIAGLQEASPESRRLLTRGTRVVHVEVEVHLLLGTVGPVGRRVIRGVLHADAPRTVGVDHAVEPRVVVDDLPVEEPGREYALRRNVSRAVTRPRGGRVARRIVSR